MNINKAVSSTLKYTVYMGVAVIAIGLILFLTDNGDSVLWAGLLILIVSPLLGVIVATIGLIKEKDMKWIAVALILIAISVANVILTKL